MPSRTVSIETSAAPLALNQDAVIVPFGNAVRQIVITTLPANAAGFVGLRAGQGGDPVRLNREGVVYDLTGADRLGGLFLVWMGNAFGNPNGIVEFLVVAPDPDECK
jgi:hypothetical protein